MASSQSVLLDRVSCGVCLEVYDNKTHLPKILPCQHTFCLSCLESIGTDTTYTECPVCRKKHNVRPTGFMTNRAMLEVVEEILKNKTSSILKCSKHTSRESVVLCTNCLDGLCMKCMKETRKTLNCHHEHQLEELDDAKSQLWQKFEVHVQEKQVNLQEKLSSMNQSAYSVAEITKTESNINEMCNKLEIAITRWKVQLAKFADYKADTTKREGEIHAQMTNLQSLLRQEDVNTVTLITELKRGSSLWDQSPGLDDSLDGNEYDLAERCKELSQQLHAELCSRESITSKPFQQEPASSQEDQLDAQRNPHRAIAVGSVTDEIVLGALFLGYIVHVFLPFFGFCYMSMNDFVNNVEWRINMHRTKEILCQLQPRPYIYIFTCYEEGARTFRRVTWCMCLLPAVITTICTSTSYSSVFLFVWTFWVVYCGVSLHFLAFGVIYVCWNPGFSENIIAYGWVAFECILLEFAKKIMLLLEEIQERKS